LRFPPKNAIFTCSSCWLLYVQLAHLRPAGCVDDVGCAVVGCCCLGRRHLPPLSSSLPHSLRHPPHCTQIPPVGAFDAVHGNFECVPCLWGKIKVGELTFTQKCQWNPYACW
jgi:hypothetical protein